MTDEEKEVVNRLGEAWDLFLALPVLHSDDVCEFRHAVHRLQEKVMARPAMRELRK